VIAKYMVRNLKSLLPMESEKIVLNNFTIACYSVNTLIIGSGAAALNAAVSLHLMGQEDILIATANWGGGTSNNAGSDKQTYYKLSLCGSEPDSVVAMAQDLFNGKCMHGDIALCEAQGSVQAFMNLVSIGVRFPHDKYGSFAGYKTDHDHRGRATSAGPYTSGKMFEALAAEVQKQGIHILDLHHCIALLTDKSGLKVIGALALNTKEKDYTKAFVLFNSTNVILGTGGPAGIYGTSVYPFSQSGSTGMAFLAGATGQNLTESQFGIASLKFRWNLSGSYQQAIPRYISTNKLGQDEKEFLNDFFPDPRSLTKAIFLKGYQWPFDPRKISKHGSSLIDILVHNEITNKDRVVWLDYSRNPSWDTGESFSLQNLDEEVKNYLRNSDALLNSPLERLHSLNAPAITLFKEHGIDLEKERLQIAVCAQHNNGGLKANIWWESDLRHLFPVGEVNGSHGVYRPGGSALNSGQVGSYRAAQYITKKYKIAPIDFARFLSEVNISLNTTLNLASSWMSSGSSERNEEYLFEIRERMSESGGIIRDRGKVAKSTAQAESMLNKLTAGISAGSVTELADAFQLMDNCITHFVYLSAISFYIENGGRSRGSYIVTQNMKPESEKKSELTLQPEISQFDRDIEKKIIEVGFKEGIIKFKMQEIREIPEQNLWFEKVWKEYLEDNYLDC
jgi:succinate dehydrogenase/fumarate reductase flavoprotein subunit